MNPVSSPSFIQPAERIASFKPYFFASLTQKLNALKAQGMDIIRLDMGSPDLPPAKFIIDALAKAAYRPDAHGYAPMGGTLDYKKACAEYYLRRFGIELDPQKEVLALQGSKEGLFNLCQVLLNPGMSPWYLTLVTRFTARAALSPAQMWFICLCLRKMAIYPI